MINIRTLTRSMNSVANCCYKCTYLPTCLIKFCLKEKTANKQSYKLRPFVLGAGYSLTEYCLDIELEITTPQCSTCVSETMQNFAENMLRVSKMLLLFKTKPDVGFSLCSNTHSDTHLERYRNRFALLYMRQCYNVHKHKAIY